MRILRALLTFPELILFCAVGLPLLPTWWIVGVFERPQWLVRFWGILFAWAASLDRRSPYWDRGWHWGRE